MGLAGIRTLDQCLKRIPTTFRAVASLCEFQQQPTSLSFYGLSEVFFLQFWALPSDARSLVLSKDAQAGVTVERNEVSGHPIPFAKPGSQRTTTQEHLWTKRRLASGLTS